MKYASAAITALLILSPAASRAAATAFNFTSGDLSAAAGPGAMYYGSSATQAATAFGSASSFGIPAIAGQDKMVMAFPSLSGVGNGYRIDHGFADNDGPTAGYMDTFTFGIDLLISTAPTSGYVGIFNTTENNSNAPEVWLHWDGTPGFWREGAGGNHGNNSLSLNSWARILFRVENSATLDIFVNGVLVANNVAWDTGDSLYTTSAPSPLGGGDFSILGDGTGYHGAGYASSIAFWDEALGDSQIASLGGVSAGGLVVPEPSAALLGLLGLTALVLRRR